MTLGFSGDVVDYYQRYRRGYPPETISTIVDTLGLTRNDVVVDLGCGTGMLTLPFAPTVRAVVGMDPEPDMLARARTEADRAGVANATWVLGADTDVPTLGSLLGEVGAVTIGRALHWMDHERLFAALRPMTRGIAVVNHATPIWLQAPPWSHALREFLERCFDTTLTNACGTDEASQQTYLEAMRDLGFETVRTKVVGSAEMNLEHVAGAVYSVLTEDQLPPAEQRPEFVRRLSEAITPYGPFVEDTTVTTLLGRVADG